MEVLIQPDEESDSLYIGFGAQGFARGSVAKTIRATEDIALDFNADGFLVGLDIMNAAAVLRPDFSAVRIDALVGVKEAAALVGVQKSNFVRDHVSRPGFPSPVAEIGAGRLWLRSQVQAYVRARRPSGSPLARKRRQVLSDA